MPFDRTTEAIAHFIGVFHLNVEAARMRDGYDAFRTAHEDATDPEHLPQISITVRAPYELKGFDPGVDYQPANIVNAFLSVPTLAGTEFDIASVKVGGFVELEAEEPHMIMAQASLVAPQWDIPLPNSIITVTVQYLTLSDNDFLDFGHGYNFVDPDVHTAKLTGMVEVAHELSLTGLSEIMETGHVPTVGEVLDVYANAMSLDGSAVEGANVTVTSGEDASGIVVNGVHVNAMPDFKDNLPAALRDDDSQDAVDETGDGPNWPDAPKMPGHHGDNDANPYQVAPGHHVTTGGNLSANEAYVGMSWVDAGVIAVMGDYVHLDIISQINVLSDHDSGGHAGASSSAVNAAQIEQISSNPDGLGMINAGTPTFPSNWQVERVEGDVVALNWIQQHVFATDFDRAEIEISGTATAIGLGGNMLGNLTSLVELGFHYDLIIIGGSMITLNLIEQINVLLDDDTIAGTTGAADSIGTGDNYLQNSASISTTGIDTVTGMTAPFQANGDALANGAGTITGGLASDPLFAGKDALSVLYISGDLIKLNAIQQYNYVGDSDQVYLALDDFIAAAGTEVTVTTGSNALLNDAHIHDAGIDSVVMAGGNVYSDALIHQANLIDTNAAPNGVVTAALSNDAVAAFLASDMIDPGTVADDAGGAAALPADSGNLDVMHSILA